MCGILGSFNAKDFDVASRLELIKHRGPDGSGVISVAPCIHGHVRLSLLDLTSASDQPFRYGDSVLSFNGEIWNFRAIRREIELLGRQFRTTGDTEVLAAALEQWGMSALPRLEGMFAFAWSKGSQHILARDRFGKIPLYVSRRGDSFVWSSERKGLGKEWPATALPPGTYLDLTTGKMHKWYSLPRYQAIDQRIIESLEAGIKARLVADAPLCCLISGGLDSSLILTLARKFKPDVVAYTAVLNDSSTDLLAARRLCKEMSVPLVEVRVRRPAASDLADAARCIEIQSKAQIEIAAMCIPLARAIASDGFRACLSGEAADELFGGYGNMCIKGSSANDEGWREIRVQQISKMSRGNFVRCNKAFMAHGVECRLPFMERSLVESVVNMSKAQCPPAKKALKSASAGIIPPWIIKRTKETFQGGAGMDVAAERAVADPAAFYKAEIFSAFGPSAKD